MAQLKVKQISDFVSAVESKVNGIVGTANVSAISVAKSEAISTANSADVVVLSSAKSYADQAETDAVNTASADATTKANAAESKAISTAVSADVVLKGQLEGYADTAEADALSNAKVYADSKDVLVLSEAKAHSDIQKGRIDTLLQGSTEALDTFKEIESFITSLETGDVAGLSTALSTAVSNDAVHAEGISANSEAIANLDLDFSEDFDAKGDADAAYAAAVTESTRLGNLAYDRLGDAAAAEGNANDYTDGFINALGTAAYNATGDFATAAQGDLADSALQDASAFDAAGSASAAQAAAIASAKSYTDGREVQIKLYADTAEADAIASAKTYTDTEIATLDSRIDGLEGASFEEVLADFVDGVNFLSRVAFNLGNVKVFVNGLQIHEAGEGVDGWSSADGINFTVSGLGYDLEGDDHIIVSGRLA